MNDPLYLDYAATTPVDNRVLDAMLPFFSRVYGNASSKHSYGRQTAEAVELAREQLASLLGCIPEELIFTSGATESCNLAIRGVAETYRSKGNHIITCSTEHKAVLDPCESLVKKGFELTKLSVRRNGLIDMDELTHAIKPQTILLTCMHANNETGVLQPVEAIGRIAKENGVLFFCDASQSAGKIPVKVEQLQADLLALSSHKLYGPKGVGALYIRRKNPRVQLLSQISGGGQERGLRSGTLNVPGIVGFGKAASIAETEMQEELKRISKYRQELEDAFKKQLDANIHGEEAPRIPHISNCRFRVTNQAVLLSELIKIAAISTGSACSSNSDTPSHVLRAMGIPDHEIRGSIRFSLGRGLEDEKFKTTIGEIIQLITKLQAEERALNK